MSSSLLSVSSLNIQIKSLLEATFMHIRVEGEVASATYHSSGHLYFSIKDNKSTIKCVMWRSSVAKMKFRIQKGLHIVVEGSVSVYTPKGEYQFQVVHIEPYGQGALALAYEQLKKKLEAKGYFEKSHKKPIPKYIQSVALVTAKQSAGLYDMLKIIEKRWALVEVTIVDTLVQGQHASKQIASALKYADSLGVDVVIVGRGGGSAEDLWCFNEEAVADALYAMQTPVVSAVGHEVDVMIADYVADLRAPTPSASIEMILPDSQELLYFLNTLTERYQDALMHHLQANQQKIEALQERLYQVSPLRSIQNIEQKFTHIQEEFERLVLWKILQKEQQLSALEQQLKLQNPALHEKKGWGQLSKDGEIIALESLEANIQCILSNTTTNLQLLCLNKYEF